jgi:hypothetical protein
MKSGKKMQGMDFMRTMPVASRQCGNEPLHLGVGADQDEEGAEKDGRPEGEPSRRALAQDLGHVDGGVRHLGAVPGWGPWRWRSSTGGNMRDDAS